MLSRRALPRTSDRVDWPQRLFQQFSHCKNPSASQVELAEGASTLKHFVNTLARHRVSLTIHLDLFVRHPGLVRWHLCRDTFHQNMHAGHKPSCFNGHNTCFFTDLRGYVEEVLLASRNRSLTAP